MSDPAPDLQALLLHEATVEDEACDSKAHEAGPPMPCPFCGVVPSVEHRRSGWRIACNNDNCPTRPDGFSYETRGEAVEAWNTPLAASIRGAEERGAAYERERCAMTAANLIAVDGHIFYGLGIRRAEQLGDAVADKLRRGGDNDGARPIKPKDLFDALRLGVEGTEADRAMLLRVMATRYQHIEGLGELAAKHHDAWAILRDAAAALEGEG